MKIKYYILSAILSICTLSSCIDNLNTDPTDEISGNIIFKDVEGGMIAMNGVYRLMYMSGWAGDNSTCFRLYVYHVSVRFHGRRYGCFFVSKRLVLDGLQSAGTKFLLKHIISPLF